MRTSGAANERGVAAVLVDPDAAQRHVPEPSREDAPPVILDRLASPDHVGLGRQHDGALGVDPGNHRSVACVEGLHELVLRFLDLARSVCATQGEARSANRTARATAFMFVSATGPTCLSEAVISAINIDRFPRAVVIVQQDAH